VDFAVTAVIRRLFRETMLYVVGFPDHAVRQWMNRCGDMGGIGQNVMRVAGGLSKGDECAEADVALVPGRGPDEGASGGTRRFPGSHHGDYIPQHMTHIQLPMDVSWARRFESESRDSLRLLVGGSDCVLKRLSSGEGSGEHNAGHVD
jgi:hypothetical protein